MPVIVRATVPASEFALYHVLDTLPDVRLEVERIIKSGEHAVMPLLWVRGVDLAPVQRAFADDESVRDVTLLAEFEREYLFRVEWLDRIRLLLQMITNSEATILDAHGRSDRWQLRVLYPSHEQLSTSHEFCDEHGLTFDIESIRELDAAPAGRYGLTEEQYQALVLAAERGYFQVPRAVSLEAVAAEIDLSHQAFSERLRRGIEALIEDTLLIGDLTDERWEN